MGKTNSRRSRVASAGLAACLATLIAVSAAFAASRSGGNESPQVEALFGGAPVTLTDCGTTDFSVLLAGEVTTAFDSESRVLELSALGPDGADVTFFVSVDDPVCRRIPALNRQFADTIREAAQSLAADCASVRHDLTVPEQAQAAWAARGVTWTPEAAEQFLAESCGGPPSPSPTP